MGLPSPQVMDFTTLRAVVSDLRCRMLPSRFEKAQQPDGQTLQLGFRTLKGMVWLELSWKADCPRLTQIPAPPKQGSGSTLAQQSQHSLRQLALVEIAQEGFERVVSFGFANRPGDPVQRHLVLELMGRHSNLLLLDERKRVVAIGRQVRDHQSRVRPIGTGDPYSPPPPLQGRPPETEESFERWRQRLSLLPLPLAKALPQVYQGISPALAQQLAKDLLKRSVDELSEAEWVRLFDHWQQWLDCLADGRFTLQLSGTGSYRVWGITTATDPSAHQPEQALSLELGRFYSDQLQTRELQRRSHELRQQLMQARNREEEQLQEQIHRLKATEDAGSLQQQADALLCLANPSREQIDQSQKLYKRAKKLRRAVPMLEERLQHHRQRLALIEGSEAFLDDVLAAEWDDNNARIERLEELRIEAQDLLAPRQRNTRRQGHPRSGAQPKPLELLSPGGLVIQLGRNHRQNEWISFKQARPGDLWFHAQECPGSHVVLKASTGLAEEADLTLAADLAALFSRARANGRVAVVMVPVEQLQRIAGAGPGTVRHRGGLVRWAVPERAEQQLKDGELLA
ncbi:MAG: NFACT RNA binding domain-containing protein [Synechococcus sp.]|nr:NFACT RNA binding domain-containing protein [Synechococcus sp.]